MRLNTLFEETKYKSLIKQGHDPKLVNTARSISKKYIVWVVKMLELLENESEEEPSWFEYDHLKLITDYAEQTNADLDKFDLSNIEHIFNYATDYFKTHHKLSYNPIFKFDNGWAIVKVPPEEIKLEGFLMRNCLKNGEYTDNIYSLRDRNNRPHVSMHIINNTIDEFGGKANSEIKDSYKQLIRLFMRSSGIKFLKFGDMDVGRRF